MFFYFPEYINLPPIYYHSDITSDGLNQRIQNINTQLKLISKGTKEFWSSNGTVPEDRVMNFVSCVAGDVTLVLPPLSSVADGTLYTFKRIDGDDANVNNLILQTASSEINYIENQYGAELIPTNTTLVLEGANDKVEITKHSDNQWRINDYYAPRKAGMVAEAGDYDQATETSTTQVINGSLVRVKLKPPTQDWTNSFNQNASLWVAPYSGVYSITVFDQYEPTSNTTTLLTETDILVQETSTKRYKVDATRIPANVNAGVDVYKAHSINLFLEKGANIWFESTTNAACNMKGSYNIFRIY